MKTDRPSWLTPCKLLYFFCTLNLLIYAERGAFASNGINVAVKDQFKLSLVQDGLLPAAFMVGLLISSPLFAEAAKHARSFYLIGCGLTIWAAAVAGSGLSFGFFSLLLCRMAVGVGEASFIALAAPFIDDNAPPDAKARWLAAFFLCIPCGFALGFLYGGIVASRIGWRFAFLLESIIIIPCIILCFNAPEMNLRGAHETGGAAEREEESHHSHDTLSVVERFEEARRDVVELGHRLVYVWTVAGMTSYTAVISTLSFYGPQAATAIFGITPRNVDLAFGGITVATGILGTMSGGVLLDKIGSTMQNASLLCAAFLAVGCLFLFSSFAFIPQFPQFCLIFALGQCFLFATMAPSNAITLWAVPAELRPLAMAISVVAMHIVGDVPAPPILGFIQSRVQNWRVSMCILISLLMAGALTYIFGAISAKTAVDFRQVEYIESLPGRVENRSNREECDEPEERENLT